MRRALTRGLPALLVAVGLSLPAAATAFDPAGGGRAACDDLRSGCPTMAPDGLPAEYGYLSDAYGPGSPPAAGSAAARGGARATLAKQASKRRAGKRLRIKVRCTLSSSDATYAGGCSGTLVLLAPHGLVAGRAHFTIPPGSTGKVSVKLSGRARAVIAAKGRLRTRVVLRSTAGEVSSKRKLKLVRR